MKIVTLLILILSGLCFAKDSSTEFLRLSEVQHKKFDQLVSDIESRKKCTGVDFACVLKEIEAIGLRCGNDLSYAANLVFTMQRRKLAMDKDCGEVCQGNVNAQVMDALLQIVKNFDVKKTFLYADLPETDPETSFLRANDDLQSFRHLQKIGDTLVMLQQNTDPEKIFDKAMAEKLKTFPPEIEKVQKAAPLKGTLLARLPPESPYFKQLTKVGENPQEVETRRRLIEDFRKAIKK